MLGLHFNEYPCFSVVVDIIAGYIVTPCLGTFQENPVTTCFTSGASSCLVVNFVLRYRAVAYTMQLYPMCIHIRPSSNTVVMYYAILNGVVLVEHISTATAVTYQPDAVTEVFDLQILYHHVVVSVPVTNA